MTGSAKNEVAKLSFEEALKELEGIVDKLERGDVPLEQSIAIYERGADLKSHCEQKLKSAELKVEQIVQSAGGKVSTETAAFD